MTTSTTWTEADVAHRSEERSFLLQRAQPAMTGLIDGSLPTLAPIFAVAFASHQPRYAFLAGLATAPDAAALTGAARSPAPARSWAASCAPSRSSSPYRAALLVALAAIAFELQTLAWIRWRFFATGFVRSIISIALGGAIIAAVSSALGAVS